MVFVKILLSAFFFLSVTGITYGQICNGSVGDPIADITFGAGTANPGPPLAPGITNMQYVNNLCPNDGSYTIANQESGCFNNWISTTDHTGDPNGYFMLINASYQPSVFFTDTINNLCSGVSYQFAAWIINMNGTSLIKPDITFSINSLSGAVLQSYNTGPIPQSGSVNGPGVWVEYSFDFTVPVGQNNILLVLTNNAPGGGGNDLGLDDITFRPIGPNIAVGIQGYNRDTIYVCADSSLTLISRVDTCFASTQYQWQLSNDTGATWIDIPGANGVNYSLILTSPGQYLYRLTVADSGNIGNTYCRVVSALMNIFVLNNLSASVTPSAVTICNGASTELVAAGGTTYAWSNAAGSDSITVSPIVTTTYSVTVTALNSCPAIASATVTVNPLPNPVINPAATQICLNQSAILTAGGGTGYVWSNAAITSAITVSPGATTVYSVTVTNVYSCTATVSATVTVNPLPTPVITATRAQICFGNSDTLIATGGVSYAWSNGANTATIFVSPGTTTAYSVTVTDANTCTASTSNTVIVNPLPIVVITPPVAQICIGKSETLTASGGINYVWDNSATSAAITVSPVADSTYSVTVTDANSCSATASKTVIVHPLPTPSVTPAATQICLNQSTVLTASGGVSYAWSNADNTASITVSPTITTTYSVTVTDANTCSATASGTVTVNPLPTPVIVPPVAQICQGYSDTLTASGGVSYVWSNTATSATIIVAPAATTTYTVLVTDTNNCSNSTSSIVTVIPYMILTLDSTNITCNGFANGTTTLTVSSGLPPYNYLWSTSATNADLTGLTPGPYSVTVTDAGGCTATASASISQPLPLALTSSYTDPTCQTFINGNISINVTGGTLPYQYNWSNSTLGPDLTDIGPGSYSVLVTDANSCTVGSVFSLAYIYDFAVHATTPLDSVYLGDTTTISYSVTGNYGAGFTSIWSPAYALSCTTCVTAVAAPDVSTLYQITITNDTGCIATDTLTIYVIPDYSIYVPNAFTPNGDRVNDYFQVYGKLNSLSYLEMRVFDRWGELVFRSNDIYFTWDGTFRGTMESPGLFVWQLNLTFLNGHSEYKKGSLTLIR
jgi:gliding motility-associated-like protein